MSIETADDECREALSQLGKDVPQEIMDRLTALPKATLLRLIYRNKGGAWEIPTLTELEHWVRQVRILMVALRKKGVTKAAAEEFVNYPRRLRVLNKLVWNILDNGRKDPRYRFPNRADLTAWRAMPKDLKTLRSIKCPTLCGWDAVEVIKVMAPYVGKHINKFNTFRCDTEDCRSNGVVGVLMALHTDAGMSKFAQHVFLHIKTNIRRASATSGIIRDSERRPSRTEVRREIGIWLSGAWVDAEADRLAHDKHKCAFSEIADASAAQKIRELAEKNLFEAEIEAPVNQEVLVTADDFVMAEVQKTGVREAKESLIREAYKLSKLPLDVVLDLIDYLNWRFAPPSGKKLFHNIKISRYVAVADLIEHIAASPDFQSNPVSLDVRMDEQSTMYDSVANRAVETPLTLAEAKETKEVSINLVFQGLNELDFSPEQYAVAYFRWKASETKSGAEIAAHFGKYILEAGKARMESLRWDCVCGTCPKCQKGKRLEAQYKLVDPDKHVSRQRIMQFEEAIQRKLLDWIFDKVFLSRVDFQSLLESAKKSAYLNSIESKLVDLVWGVGGDEEANLIFVVANLDKIIGPTVAKDRQVLKEALILIKQKLLRAVL